MAETRDLFDGVKSRRKPRVLMHVCDAGDSGAGRPIAQLRCGRCGHETGWLEFDSVTEAKRGLPCEKCNGPH